MVKIKQKRFYIELLYLLHCKARITRSVLVIDSLRRIINYGKEKP